MLRPFFSWYGSKYRMASKLGGPQRDIIIEPFAGSACYSCYWHRQAKQVILVDIDPVIVGLWRYLIKAKESEISSLPVDIDTTESLSVCEEAKWLIGFWFNRGLAAPARNRQATSWAKYSSTMLWRAEVRDRIAAQLKHIRHWQVIEGSYAKAPDLDAHWHIDPPYQQAGRSYRYNDINYPTLAGWCRTRRGYIQVCEHTSADWLPFVGFARTKGCLGKNRKHVSSGEAVFTLGETRNSVFEAAGESTMTMTMEQHLVKATGVKPKGDRQKFLANMIRAVNALSKEQWNRLSDEAQEWYNVAAEQLDEDKEIDDFPRSPAEEAEAESEAEAAEAAEAATTETQGNTQAKKGPSMAKNAKKPAGKPAHAARGNGKMPPKKVTAPPKKAAAAPPKRQVPARTARRSSDGAEGATTIIRREIIKNPGITAAELDTILKKKGSECSIVATSSIRAHAMSLLLLLKGAGKLKEITVPGDGVSPRANPDDGATAIIRREIVRNPKISAKELKDALQKKGGSCSEATLNATRAHAVSLLKMLNAAGHLKGMQL